MTDNPLTLDYTPWEIHRERDGCDDYYAITIPDREIAQIRFWGYTEHDDATNRARADARLIAKAPEMFAMLSTFLQLDPNQVTPKLIQDCQEQILNRLSTQPNSGE